MDSVDKIKGAVFSFVLIFLLSCNMGEDRGDKIPSFTIKTDAESIQRGRDIFVAQCTFCHKANSTETLVGPGLKGILNRAKLPVSKKPATPENIVHQMKRPYQKMPSFPYFSEEEIQDILAYLNTL
ncbi:cytochrome c [bacterium]|nr:MAG: cytochrome c [bacterium]